MLFITQPAQSQSLGDAIVHITFGSGTNRVGPSLAADSGHTDYIYTGAVSPDDGQYGIYNTTAGLNTGWVTTADHTGDPNGYMMVVNASYAPGIFYTRRIDGLCGSTTYQFGAWIKNILRGTGILPNVTFSIEALDGSPLGAPFGTGDIAANDTWNQYVGTFTTSASGQSVIVKMTNNAPGGGGNDIAIDDITFRPYGTTLTATFSESETNFCSISPKTIHLRAQTPLDNNYSQRVQRSSDYGKTWVNQGAPSMQPDFAILTPSLPGAYSYRLIKADAANIDVSACVVASNILNINVLPPPTVSFTAPYINCQGDSVKFTDQTDAGNLKITGWHWDFDDNGATSDVQNPEHLFTTPGIHKVTLNVTTDAGCGGASTKAIHVYGTVQTKFNSEVTNCLNRSLLFTQTSLTPESNITNCKWDFGDGTAIVDTGPSPYPHMYAVAGTYTVTLTVTTDKGCMGTISQAITVHNPPQADFILPEVCVSDAYAQFQDNSTTDYPTTLSYLWNFGDDKATPGNPNTSTEKNPKHRYSEAKVYPVSLTITTSDGCQVVSQKNFTVNGANPHAEFTPLNAGSLCSNKEVDLVNNSTIDFGNVARIKWDFGDGTPAVTDQDPAAGKLYHHRFPVLSTPKSYTITMTAYSGNTDESCQNQVQHVVNVNGAPQLVFAAPDSVCLNFGKVQFAARETGGVAGSGVYTGVGVTSAGLFDPEMAGVGTFDMTYTYTSAAGCSESIVHAIKVNSLTRIDAGPDVIIPDDETTILHPIVSGGEPLTYLWTPATGLSNATIANPQVKINDDVTYTLTVTNRYGCQVSDQVKVSILHKIIPPNTFTPNGDGVNDTWVIKYLSVFTGCTVDVFNRNGQKVYSSIGYSEKGWDGRYQGFDLPAGVYYYIINPKHGKKVLSGFVTIIR